MRHLAGIQMDNLAASYREKALSAERLLSAQAATLETVAKAIDQELESPGSVDWEAVRGTIIEPAA
jgi:hypothetical protein